MNTVNSMAARDRFLNTLKRYTEKSEYMSSVGINSSIDYSDSDSDC